MYTISHNELNELPPGLTFIKLNRITEMERDSFAMLPAGLLHLKLRESFDSRAVQYLPRSLESLCLQFTIDFNETTIAELPRSLTMLKVNRRYTMASTRCGPNLPPLLKYLRLPLTHDHRFITQLPSSITTLELNSSVITTNHFKYLPKTITRLKLSYLTCTNVDKIRFPPQLYEFIIEKCKTRHNVPWIHKLPPTLGLFDFDKDMFEKDAPVNTLPQYLKTLILGGSRLVNDGLEYLPSGITKLELKLHSSMTNECARYLPSHLVYLILPKNNILTDACVLYLPRTLTWLDLSSNPNLTDQCALALPPGLSHFMAFDSKFTHDGIDLFPKSLVYLSINLPRRNIDRMFKSLHQRLYK
jgi:hypothetical protein